MSSLPLMMVGALRRAVLQQRDHPLRERRHVRIRPMNHADASAQLQFAPRAALERGHALSAVARAVAERLR
ncbi:hypothetical protein [Burkholderia sp. 22313]|uniref:hypothetical protein n=1 Tax=Burkholderia sp. 22313 TaxID=3453908 RepID=UPI003F85FDEA